MLLTPPALYSALTYGKKKKILLKLSNFDLVPNKSLSTSNVFLRGAQGIVDTLKENKH